MTNNHETTTTTLSATTEPQHYILVRRRSFIRDPLLQLVIGVLLILLSSLWPGVVDDFRSLPTDERWALLAWSGVTLFFLTALVVIVSAAITMHSWTPERAELVKLKEAN